MQTFRNLFLKAQSVEWHASVNTNNVTSSSPLLFTNYNSKSKLNKNIFLSIKLFIESGKSILGRTNGIEGSKEKYKAKLAHTFWDNNNSSNANELILKTYLSN